jgi:hypothetical protein
MKKLFLVLVFALCSTPAFAQANLQGDVARARAKYPTPMSAAQQAAVVNEVAWLHRAEGWAVLGKPGGNNCPQPRTGTPLSCDFLVYKPSLSGFDVLSDAEGAGRVQWDGPKPGVQASQVVEAVEPEGTVEPPPPPPPTGDLEARLQARGACREARGGHRRREHTAAGGCDTLAVLREQLATSKQILELLKKTAGKFGVQ